jgi:folate-dependent phosphoribosylglycinamide formyltransferase PurN
VTASLELHIHGAGVHPRDGRAPILTQQSVSALFADTEEMLLERIKADERSLYPGTVARSRGEGAVGREADRARSSGAQGLAER